MEIGLYDYQLKALDKMKNGCILCGGVGSGKSRTGLGYYFLRNGGSVKPYKEMKDPKDLYIITTARKRDTKEWEGDMAPYLLSTDEKANKYKNKVTVDSWNNIGKYSEVQNAFFIFDEQRVVGYGAWTKSFLKIAKYNEWILLSATPGDTWLDYMPVFIANGFYKNKSDFLRQHVVYSRYCSKFPKIDRYVETGRLVRLRNNILVDMQYYKPAESHHIDISVCYDIKKYKDLFKTRWNDRKNEPIENASELCYELRRICNEDTTRLGAVLDILTEKKKVIIFYNFDYELDLLKDFMYDIGVEYSEWNGHKHQPVPECDEWAYLVQYTAGAEGWNCIKTDTIIFYSQNYSYKIMQQSSGRIDRLNAPFRDLYYYHLKSKSSIDIAIARALSNKKKFNESRFVEG